MYLIMFDQSFRYVYIFTYFYQQFTPLLNIFSIRDLELQEVEYFSINKKQCTLAERKRFISFAGTKYISFE